MSPRLAFALEAAFRAGRSTLRHFQTGLQVDAKEDQTPVTQADREAESLLREMIEQSYPGESILGEEFGGDEQAATGWVIDPIDGTKSFICGVPLYATLLSYEVEGEPVLGVAYFPAIQEMIYAETGLGAFWNGRPCRVSSVDQLEGATICCGGHATAAKLGRLDGIVALAEKCRATRTWCDAYGHCLVATGRAEAMIDPRVARWDISSVGLIVREAGGCTTTFDGDPIVDDELISSNGVLHESILGAFRT